MFLSCLNSCDARARSGIALSMDDIYASISSDASSGSNTLGGISNALIGLGLTVGAAQQALQVVAQQTSNPQQLQVLNGELSYLSTYQPTPSRSWVLPLVIGLGLLWLVAGKKT